MEQCDCGYRGYVSLRTGIAVPGNPSPQPMP
jgi:hypothetical protein